MVPSLPPLRTIQPEQQPSRQALAAPAAYPRLAPLHAHLQLAQQQQQVAQQYQQVAWRRVKTEADSDAYALHRQQLQSMTQHVAPSRLNSLVAGSLASTTSRASSAAEFPISERFNMASGRSSLSSSSAGLLAVNEDEEDDQDEDQHGDLSVSKKARRKEQCRVNQANYRKRKRMYENELSGQIKLLESEILELKARKEVALNQHSQSFHEDQHEDQHEIKDPIQAIGDFYYALESAQFELPSTGARGLRYPELQSLFELQQQEFSCMEALQLQWLWYREHFVVFHLLVSSSERLDAGDQVIIRISAQLHIQMQQSHDHHLRRPDHETSTTREARWLASKLVCPVLQHFEFHAHERVLTQITSEVDWLAGVAATAQSPPEHTLLLLRELADQVAASAY